METLNAISAEIIVWTISYLFHGTLIFISVHMVFLLKVATSNEVKESLLRFPLIGAVFTPLLQFWIGRGHSFVDFGNTEFIMDSPSSIGLTTFHWQFHWPIMCVMAWFIISSLLFLRYRVSVRKFLQSSKPYVPANSKIGLGIGLHGDLFQAANVRLLISPTMVSPFVYDQNTIVIPELAIRKFTPNEIRSILAHELAHIERRDWIWLQIYNIFQCVFFFQPLNKLIKTKLIRVSETICDAKAVQMTGDKKSMASSILEVASWRVSKPSTVALGFAFRPSFIKQRIESIIDPKPVDTDSSKWNTPVMIIILCSLCLLVTPVFSVKNGDKGINVTHPTIYPVTDKESRGRSAPFSIKKENKVPKNPEINLEVEMEVVIELIK